MTTLTVKGLGRQIDGVYEFDLADVTGLNGSEALTMRERHQIKQLADIRGGEIQEALSALDAAAWVAFVFVLLGRQDKVVNPDRIWDSRFVFSEGKDIPELVDDAKQVIHVHIGDLVAEQEEAEDDPPAVAAETSQPSRSGTGSSKQTSEISDDDPSRTGDLVSLRSAT